MTSDVFMDFLGIRVIFSPILTTTVTEQTRFPRSKKKRIHKKFRKRYSVSRTVPSMELHMIGNHTVICHPVVKPIINKLIKELNSEHSSQPTPPRAGEDKPDNRFSAGDGPFQVFWADKPLGIASCFNIFGA